MRPGALRWRAAVPGRWSWVRLLAAPSSYLLVVALVVTLVAKLKVVHGLDGVGAWPLHGLLASAADVAVFLGLAALLALGERVSRWMLLATLPIALLVAAVAVINAAYLAISGEQLSWPVLTLGLARSGDVQAIAGIKLLGPLAASALLLGVLVPPALAMFALRRAAHPIGP
ncbi:MAG: hypothetical protein H0T79_10235, partial [Deltaproteobacteria bacterium]|nr:hypothetical protein [Deltaproteobacteria bacterium]